MPSITFYILLSHADTGIADVIAVAATNSSTTVAGKGRVLAVDGKAATCMQTNKVTKPWLVLDLGRNQAVSRVVVTNR